MSVCEWVGMRPRSCLRTDDAHTYTYTQRDDGSTPSVPTTQTSTNARGACLGDAVDAGLAEELQVPFLLLVLLGRLVAALLV